MTSLFAGMMRDWCWSPTSCISIKTVVDLSQGYYKTEGPNLTRLCKELVLCVSVHVQTHLFTIKDLFHKDNYMLLFFFCLFTQNYVFYYLVLSAVVQIPNYR